MAYSQTQTHRYTGYMYHMIRKTVKHRCIKLEMRANDVEYDHCC